MAALTPEEADRYMKQAVEIFEKFEEAERRPSSAIPREIMKSGEAKALVAVLIATLAEAYPSSADERIIDVAASFYRSRH